MVAKFFLLIIGFICGYLLIHWVPVIIPFTISEYLAEYLFDPLKFFAIMISFFIGFLVNSILIRTALEETIRLLLGRKIRIGQFMIGYSVCGSFYLLFQLGFWQTLILLCFSLIYGIISIDIYRDKIHERNR